MPSSLKKGSLIIGYYPIIPLIRERPRQRERKIALQITVFHASPQNAGERLLFRRIYRKQIELLSAYFSALQCWVPPTDFDSKITNIK